MRPTLPRLLLLCGLLAGPATVAARSEAPFLWRVQGPEATHYLMGSVHLLPASAYPLPTGLQQAFEATESLVMEADPEALAAPGVADTLARAGRDGDGLGAEVGDALLQRVQRRAAGLGLPASVCDRLRAWFCALTLGMAQFQRAGMDPGLGLDQHFHRQAVQQHRPLRWLETPDAQFELFTGMDVPMARQFLDSTLRDLDRPDLRPAALVAIWQRHDTDALARLIADTARDYPRFHERLMAARNRAWANRLQPWLLDPTAQLVIVGAGHLVGPDNLVDALRDRGLHVERVAR